MRNKSHAAMGRRLLREYMPGLPRRYTRIFLLGCIQPDKNPATYIKGSLRSQWLRGHNYSNAHRYMMRLANRLEVKSHFSYWDYYSLGKLIHYTMDAFTLPHNNHFPTALRSHRCYEIQLQRYFLPQLHRFRKPNQPLSDSAAELIRRNHAQYMRLPGSVETDTDFACRTCFLLMGILTEKITAYAKSPTA